MFFPMTGNSFSNKETFGQFPLQVEGNRDIHESLERAMAVGEIFGINNEAKATSGQEVSSFTTVVIYSQHRTYFQHLPFNTVSIRTGFVETDLECLLFQQWFTRLPPVLTFELSRFQFNQQLGRPEKIHHQLRFPQSIYMDRYACLCLKILKILNSEHPVFSLASNK